MKLKLFKSHKLPNFFFSGTVRCLCCLTFICLYKVQGFSFWFRILVIWQLPFVSDFDIRYFQNKLHPLWSIDSQKG